ncbi:MAG: MFS transporter [Saprospiraceae bacterium]|nr:MFS transporter [Saprospiraceae bacterium]
MLLRIYHHWVNSYRGIPHAIWFLSLVSLINRCGSMVISFITLYLTQRLQFTIEETGYVMGFFGAGALLGAYLGGRLTDRIGAGPVMFWSLIFNGLILIGMLEVQHFWPMCATVFMMSISSEVFRPANSVAIRQSSTPETRTRAISLYRMSVNLGFTVAPALGGLLATLGWHWLFWVDGLTCIAAAIMLRQRYTAPAAPATVPAQPEEETAAAAAGDSPFRDRPFMWFIAFTVINAVVFMQILWTVPVFFKEAYHWPEAQIGLLMALNGLVVFLVEMPLIFRIDGTRQPSVFIRVGLVLYMLSYLSLAVAFPPMLAASLYMVIISFGEIFVMPFSSNYVMSRSPEKRLGQYMAVYTMAYSCSNILAPLMGTQVIAAWGFRTLWLIAIGLALVAWVGFGVMERRGHYQEVRE